MRTRIRSFSGKRYLLAAIVVGAAAGALPALASSAGEPTVSAICASECTSLYAKYAWSPSEAAIAAGGTVRFANTTPGTPHGIVWSSSLKPSCASSVPVGQESSSSEEWSGACTFSQPGTYTYYCSVHGLSMSGTIHVSAEGTTTTSPPGTTPSTETTTSPSVTTPTSPAAPGPLLAGSASSALKVAKSQHRGAVRGSIALAKAAVGGRLEVKLLATRLALAGGRSHALVAVGRLVRSLTSSGSVHFAVALSKPARHVLAHRHRLALVVKVVLTPIHGQPLTIARAVIERV